jgi:hypothetical protein
MLLNHMHLKCHLKVASWIHLYGVILWQCHVLEGKLHCSRNGTESLYDNKSSLKYIFFFVVRRCADIAIFFDLVDKIMSQCNSKAKLWTTGYIISINKLSTDTRFSLCYLKHRFDNS